MSQISNVLYNLDAFKMFYLYEPSRNGQCIYLSVHTFIWALESFTFMSFDTLSGLGFVDQFLILMGYEFIFQSLLF